MSQTEAEEVVVFKKKSRKNVRQRQKSSDDEGQTADDFSKEFL